MRILDEDDNLFLGDNYFINETIYSEVKNGNNRELHKFSRSLFSRCF